MRFKEPYTLTSRPNSSGKKVFYYRTYDNDGQRTTARSTGQTTITAAKAYCELLRKEGQLIPIKKQTQNLAAFAEDFWLYGKCQYIRGKLMRGMSMGQTHCDNMRAILENHILPVFGPSPLIKITPQKIDRWLLSLPDKGLSSSTANRALACLEKILGEAQKQNLLHSNPCANVQRLANKAKTRGILEQLEASKLLSAQNWATIWQNRFDCFIGNRLAAITGMRLGEIRALQVNSIKYDSEGQPFLLVDKSYDDKEGLKTTKTGKARDILIPSEIEKNLRKLLNGRFSGFIFTNDGGASPITKPYLRRSLSMALEQIGIDAEQTKARNITFHSWRHYFNTTLRAAGVADSKLQAMTGHTSQAMTEHYSHLRISDLEDVRRAQLQLVEKLA